MSGQMQGIPRQSRTAHARPLTVAVSLFVAMQTLTPATALGQSDPSVQVNLGVLYQMAPADGNQRLLMPSPSAPRSRIVLTPPPGVEAIQPNERIVLRPPSSMAKPSQQAATIAVPPRAAAASAPPTSVTAPPPPAPVPTPVVEAEDLETASEGIAPAIDDTMANAVDAEMSEPGEAAIGDAMAAMPAQGTAPAPPLAPAAANPPPPPSQTPVPEPAPSTSASEQVASRPPATSAADLPTEDDPLRIPFQPGEENLPAAAGALLQDLATTLSGDESLRVQLLAYASETEGDTRGVRRMSLSRALAVREFLMEQGVDRSRIEVRALGDQTESGPADRVDALVIAR